MTNHPVIYGIIMDGQRIGHIRDNKVFPLTGGEPLGQVTIDEKGKIFANGSKKPLGEINRIGQAIITASNLPWPLLKNKK